ncbi:MAG TPA: hypothetical protein VLA90_10645 [Actinomycetota bacterium]|nr:hypothetical protein [Actinomycetota bacterium]
MTTEPSQLRCHLCGVGVLGDIAYDEHTSADEPRKQAPESREVLAFSCGHEVLARELGEAARDDPNVERRETPQTVEPIDPEGGRP